MLQSSLIKYTTIFLIFSLSACSTAPDKIIDDVISDAVRHQAIDKQVDLTVQQPPEYYIKLASESSGELQQKYLIKAAELLYQRGDISSAQSQLENIKGEEIADSRHIRVQLLAAKIALANHNPSQAIELLPKQKKMTVGQFIEISKTRAEANIAMGYLLEATKTLIQIDGYLKDDDLRENNHTMIWSVLNTMPTTVLNKLRSSNQTLQGWLELTKIVRTAQINNYQLENNILDWRIRFKQHPVSKPFLRELLEERTDSQIEEYNIAVFLPLNGRYQAASAAIKAGILSAYYADIKMRQKPTIRFYDTSDKDLDFMALSKKAVEDGADYIIGPLDKSVISQLTQSASFNDQIDIPMLTLNYAENIDSIAENLYQFGLLPEDEARQVAEMAIRQNKTKAAILVPNGLWGQRLKVAFQQRYEELGGQVLSAQFFNNKIDDFGLPIKHLFNVQFSNHRHKDLQRLLRTELKYSPYRRQDIDMVFLAATSRPAQSIMPAFKFHHAGGIPVYSTSHVYTGNRRISADLDLNGLSFCDIPWILAPNNQLKKNFNKNWPEQKNYTRLFALGIDSYHLLQNLTLLAKDKQNRFAGQTGNIYLDENQRLHRELLWAEFRKGKALYIDTTIAPKPRATIEKNQS